MLQIYAVTRASAVDKTEDRCFQPRRSPRKHSSDRELDNRAAARASSSSSFGVNFDRSAFEHPSPDVDIESMPPASKRKVGSDAYDGVKMYDDAPGRCLAHSSSATSEPGGGATSAGGNAASPGHELLDSLDKMRNDLRDYTSKKLKEDRKTRTLMGSELVEYVIRQHQLSPVQVASMAVPIIIREAGQLLRVFPGDYMSPPLYT